MLYRLLGGRNEYDDKDQPLLEDDTAQSRYESGSMEREIRSFRTAADIVGEMVAAEEGLNSNRSSHPSEPLPVRSITITQVPASVPIPITHSSRMSFDLSSQVGEGEELPAYQYENAGHGTAEAYEDASEMSSVIADGGFGGMGNRYTPSVSSAASGLNDVLGPDTKN